MHCIATFHTHFSLKSELLTRPGCMEDCNATHLCWTISPLLYRQEMGRRLHWICASNRDFSLGYIGRSGNYKIIQPVLRTGFTCPALFFACPQQQIYNKCQNFSLSFGQVSKFFTCPPVFLPVPDRRTVCNFHPR